MYSNKKSQSKSKLSFGKSSGNKKNYLHIPSKFTIKASPSQIRKFKNESKQKSKAKEVSQNNKSKKNAQDSNSKINIIINNPITSFGSLGEEEKNSEGIGSTFFFTGGELINLDKNNILEQFLVNSNATKNYENEFYSNSKNFNNFRNSRKVKSFSLVKPNENFKEKEKEEKINEKNEKKDFLENESIRKKLEDKKCLLLKFIEKIKNLDFKKYQGKFQVVLLLLINGFVYFYIIINNLEVSFNSFTVDDHLNYIYISSKISDNTGITSLDNK